jgi:hypothetical protein
MSLVMLGGVALSPLSMALTGVLVDLGLVALVFAGGGALIVLAALVGILWGVPTHMRDG